MNIHTIIQVAKNIKIPRRLWDETFQQKIGFLTQYTIILPNAQDNLPDFEKKNFLTITNVFGIA